MRLIRKIRIALLLVVVSLMTPFVYAQDGTINIFNPYSMYGIGAISPQGTPSSLSMAGAGVASRSVLDINTQNPASYSMASAKSFLLSFGMLGENNYLKNSFTKTSHNSFNLSDVSLSFRLAKRLGFGFTMSPYSNVGYYISRNESNPDIIESVGKVEYRNSGTGSVNRLKTGFGWMPLKNFSFGVNYVYYLGSIDKFSQTLITPIINSNQYRNTVVSETQRLNQSAVEIGLQYSFVFKNNRSLVLGAVYQPKIKSSIKDTREGYLYEGSFLADTIFSSVGKMKYSVPNKVILGATYKTTKLNLSVDYEYNQWGGTLENEPENRLKYVSTHQGRLGFEYIPNRFDIRSQLKRWTYRVGVRYGNSYMNMNGQDIKEYAVSFGLGIPIQRGGFSLLNIGAEFGKQGTTKNGLVANRFARVFLGFSLFANNEWFIKQKFK